MPSSTAFCSRWVSRNVCDASTMLPNTDDVTCKAVGRLRIHASTVALVGSVDILMADTILEVGRVPIHAAAAKDVGKVNTCALSTWLVGSVIICAFNVYATIRITNKPLLLLKVITHLSGIKVFLFLVM